MQINTPMVSAPTGTRIRAYFGGKPLADSSRALLVRESPFKMNYAFPQGDVQMSFLTKLDKEPESPSKGRILSYHIDDGSGSRAEKSAYAYPDLKEGRPNLRGYILLNWNAMDSWYEEEEEMLGHPRDPFTRIDVRKSSKHVVVKFNDTVIADSSNPRILLETGLPIRYYIPESDIHWDYLVPIEKTTVCPYKGKSKYWSIQVKGEEAPETAWAYPEPLQDAERVKGTVCFYQEKLSVYVDDQPQEQPPSYFTK